jgi:hypothetical protein
VERKNDFPEVSRNAPVLEEKGAKVNLNCTWENWIDVSGLSRSHQLRIKKVGFKKWREEVGRKTADQEGVGKPTPLIRLQRGSHR